MEEKEFKLEIDPIKDRIDKQFPDLSRHQAKYERAHQMSYQIGAGLILCLINLIVTQLIGTEHFLTELLQWLNGVALWLGLLPLSIIYAVKILKHGPPVWKSYHVARAFVETLIRQAPVQKQLILRAAKPTLIETLLT